MQISDNHFTHVYEPNKKLLLRELEWERRAKERCAELNDATRRSLPIQRLAVLFSRAPRSTVTPLSQADPCASSC